MSDNVRVQELTLELLKKYIAFCEENNLKYFITGGALIGVLRHKGFIPWDDDIDVGMPRKDYDKFIDLVKTNTPKGCGICDRYTNLNWHFAMSQFCDENTEIEINLSEKVRRANIWIDVFPLDGLPNNRLKRGIRIRHILYLRYKIQLANIDVQVDSHRKRPFLERIVLKCAKLFHFNKLINTNKNLDKLDKLLKKSDYDSAIYVGNMLGRYRKKEVVLKEYFGTPKDGLFEGISVNIPEQSDLILTALYGDYMKLPPEEERVAHNVKILSK